MRFIYGEQKAWTHIAQMNSKPLPMDHEAWSTHGTKPMAVMVYDVDETAYKQRHEYQAEKSGQTTIV